MDCEAREEAVQAAIALAMERPKWRLSLQAHKVFGLRLTYSVALAAGSVGAGLVSGGRDGAGRGLLVRAELFVVAVVSSSSFARLSATSAV